MSDKQMRSAPITALGVDDLEFFSLNETGAGDDAV